MSDTITEAGTVCDKIVKSFLNQLATIEGFEEIARRLEGAILNKKPTEALIRSALFEEKVL